MTKILMVEDDRITSRALTARLESCGYEVVPVFDAAQATTMAVKHRPDLVLIDVMIPAGNGFMVAGRLHQLTATAAVPIIMMSASPEPEVREKARQIGAAFLAKPFENPELLAAIQEALSRPKPAVDPKVKPSGTAKAHEWLEDSRWSGRK